MLNFQEFWKNLISDQDPLTLKLDLRVSAQDSARFFLYHNDIKLYDNVLAPGPHSLEFALVVKQTNLLKFGMLDKNLLTDTKVENGQIVQDKFIELVEFSVNNFDLVRDYDFFYNKLKYYNHDQGQYTQVSNGFWFNSEIVMEYESPFIQWYTENTHKNTQVSPTMIHRASSTEVYNAVEAKLCEQLLLLKQ